MNTANSTMKDLVNREYVEAQKLLGVGLEGSVG